MRTCQTCQHWCLHPSPLSCCLHDEIQIHHPELEVPQRAAGIRHTSSPLSLFLSQYTKVAVERLPVHCSLSRGGRVIRSGSCLEQPNQAVSFSEAIALLKHHFNSQWAKKQKNNSPSDDQMLNLKHHQQNLIFYLHTGHCCCQTLNTAHTGWLTDTWTSLPTT